MKLPFKNAKIVGENIPYALYAQQPVDEIATAKNAGVAAIKLKPEKAEWIYVKRGNPFYVMSRGELCDFISCPMRWLENAKNESTDSLRYGSLLDILVLTPDVFESQYAVAPETYTNEDGEEKPWNLNSKACKAWVAKHSDRIIVKQKDVDEAESAVVRLFRDDKIKDFINCSKKQVMVSADYHDAETGLVIPVRVLTDLLPDPKNAVYGKSIGDFKTSKDASVRKWSKSVSIYGYDMQAALNLDLHAAATPDVERIEFRHVIQESESPYQTGRRILSEEFIQIGRAKYMAALKLYAKCLKHNFWPDYEIGNSVMNGWSLTEPTSWDIENALAEVVVNFPNAKSELENQESDLIP